MPEPVEDQIAYNAGFSSALNTIHLNFDLISFMVSRGPTLKQISDAAFQAGIPVEKALSAEIQHVRFL